MTRRSDALQALVAEVVDLDRDVAQALAVEEEARTEFVAARQTLDLATGERTRLEGRRGTTHKALELVQKRDDVSDETVTALMGRARR